MKLYNDQDRFNVEYPNDWSAQKIARDQGIRNRILLLTHCGYTKTYRAYNTKVEFSITED